MRTLVEWQGGHYLLHEEITNTKYEIIPWMHDGAPSRDYTVGCYLGTWHCSCAQNDCVHVALTRKWIEQDMPAVLLASAPEICAAYEGEEIVFPKDSTYLEPYYNKLQLEQHLIHHIKYLANYEKAKEALDTFLQKADYANAELASRDMIFNKSGGILHSYFWASLANNQDVPQEVKRVVSKDFDSFEGFRRAFLQKANSLKGSGWLFVMYCPADDRIVLQMTANHDAPVPRMVPLLVLDLWEHAYGLQYLDRRDDWSRTFFDNLANWDHFLSEYHAAMPRV